MATKLAAVAVVLSTVCVASGVRADQPTAAEPVPDLAGETPAAPADQTPPDLSLPADATEETTQVDEAPSVPPTACEGKEIVQIVVRGNDRVADSDIVTTLGLRPHARCSDADITTAVHSLWDLGFFDDILVEADDAQGGVTLRITVAERPAIAAIEYEGNSEVESSDLTERVTLREGEVLSIPEVRRQVTRVRDLYAEKGFFLARVRYAIEPKPNNEATVRFLIDEGPEVTVRRVRFVGNRLIRDAELRGFMQTGQTGFWSFMSSNNTFNRGHFDDDVGNLQAVYYDRGYLTIEVGAPRVELTPDRRAIDITVPLREGPRFRIGQLRVIEVDDEGEEREALGGRREVRSKIEANPGDWFSRSVVGMGLQNLTRYYRDHGYAHVEVNAQPDLDLDRRVVNLAVSIRRGPPVRIERINIRGNTKTRDLVIRREIQLVEGELYNQTGIEESKARIHALGYFETVTTSEEEGSTPDAIVVNFEVEERPTSQIQAGMGFSSLESFIFTLQTTQPNLLGRGQSLTAQFQLSGIRQLGQVRLVEPYLLGTDWTAAIEGFLTRRLFEDFTRDSTGGSATVGHPLLDDRLRLYLQYRADVVDISARTGPVFGSTAGAGFSLYRRLPLANLFRDGLTSSLRLSLTWDSRDNRLAPTRGIYASASSEVADEWVGSDNVFLRNEAYARFYYPLFGGIVLRFNGEGGIITSRDPRGVPVFERYFLGGIFNVRGFRINRLGPRLGIPLSTDPNARVAPEGAVFGGNLQLFYNAEIVFPILESVGIQGVLFTDGGNAWNLERTLCAPAPPSGDPTTDPCSMDVLALRTSWGFGIRWISPLGPLRFELGFPFAARPYEESSVFEFTIGNFF